MNARLTASNMIRQRLALLGIHNPSFGSKEYKVITSVQTTKASNQRSDVACCCIGGQNEDHENEQQEEEE